MVTVIQGKVCAKNHPDRLSRLATIHQRYRRTDGRISYGIGLDLTVGQKSARFRHRRMGRNVKRLGQKLFRKILIANLL